jgi:hypothetical protein
MAAAVLGAWGSNLGGVGGAAVEFSHEIKVQAYEGAISPHRLAVGDVIRCQSFRLGHKPKPELQTHLQGLPQLGSEGETNVAWREEARLRHYVEWVNSTNWGKGSLTYAIDDARGSALYLVTRILLDETWGPEDVGAPARLYRVIGFSRLSEDRSKFYLERNAERIHFVLDDPMSLCSPRPGELEIVGHALLPVGWS